MEHDRGVISLVEKLDSQTRRKLEHRFKKAIVRQLFGRTVSCLSLSVSMQPSAGQRLLLLRLGETASIISELCIFKRYSLFDLSCHLSMYGTLQCSIIDSVHKRHVYEIKHKAQHLIICGFKMMRAVFPEPRRKVLRPTKRLHRDKKAYARTSR